MSMQLVVKALVIINIYINYIHSFHINTKFINIQKKNSININYKRNYNQLNVNQNSVDKSIDPIESFIISVNDFFSNIFNPQTKQAVIEIVKIEDLTIKPKNAVLIFGGTSRLSIEIIKKLIIEDRDVILTGRNSTKLLDIYENTFNKSSKIFIKSGVDVTKPEAITSDLFEGVTQIISSLGPTFNSNITSEQVDYLGNQLVINESKKYLTKNSFTTKSLISFNKSDRNISLWSPLNDQIMGGKSTSNWQSIDWNNQGDNYLQWTGNVITEGGGFAGTIVKDQLFQPYQYDGIQITAKNPFTNNYDKRIKLRIKISNYLNSTQSLFYQSSFDVKSLDFSTTYLPFDNFIAVSQGSINYNPNIPKLQDLVVNNPDIKIEIGLVYSKFGYDELPNPFFKAGSFAIDISNISFYKQPLTQFLLISSGGAERIQKLDEVSRVRDIPIVQLNPLGILSWKYKAEEVLRQSGLDYTILRPAGLVPTGAIEDRYRFIIGQGDRFAGRITRSELAVAIVSILKSINAVNKSFEIKRDEGDIIKNIATDLNYDLKFIYNDIDRAINGIDPLPRARDPPPPVTPERVKEILSNPQTQAAREREKNF